MNNRTTAFHMEDLTECLLPVKKPFSSKFASFCLAGLVYFGLLFSMYSLYAPLIYRKYLTIAALTAFFGASMVCLWVKRCGAVLTGISLLTLIGVWLFRKRILTGMLYMYNIYYSSAHHTETAYFLIGPTESPVVCATLACAFFSILLACCFTYFVIHTPSFFFVAAISLGCLEMGLYRGLPLHPLAFAPLLAGLCGLLGQCCIYRHIPDSESGKRIAFRSGTNLAWMILIIYLLVFEAGTFGGYTRTEADRQRMRDLSHSLSAFDIQDFPQRLKKIGVSMGLFQNDQESLLGRSASLEYQDKKALTLTFDDLPTSAVYFKGFTGSIYHGDSWSKAKIDASGQTWQINDIIQKFGCAPQNFPYLFQRTILPESETLQCTVTSHLRDGRYYQPYVSYSDDVNFPDDESCLPAEQNSYNWTMLQNTDISQILETPMQQTELLAEDLHGSGQIQKFVTALGISEEPFTVESRFPLSSADQIPDIPGKVIPAAMMDSLLYRDHVKEVDTVLPESADLADIFAAMPKDLSSQRPQTAAEQYETLRQIRKWIAACAVYDLSPGKTPQTRDFIRFFLLENHKGYCVHFASAGTVIARYLGIPARYCEGYLLGDDVLQQAKETRNGYTVTLTDRQAHAWCECYIDGFGWIPFEMTPGYSEEAVHIPPQASSTTLPESQPMVTTAISVTTTATTAISVTTSAPQTTASAFVTVSEKTISSTAPPSNAVQESDQAIPLSHPNLLAVCTIIIGSLAAVIFLLILLHRWHIRGRISLLRDISHPKQAIFRSYGYFLRLMRWIGLPYSGGLLTDYQQNAQRFLEQKHLPTEASQLIEAALAADLSGHPPTPQTVKTAAEAVLSLAKAIEQSYRIPKRLYLKYLIHLF